MKIDKLREKNNKYSNGKSQERKIHIQKKPSKKFPFTWDEPQETAFQTIKDTLTKPPILAYANYQLPFVVHTDASSTDLGAVIYQRQAGVDRVIAYASRSLKPSGRH